MKKIIKKILVTCIITIMSTMPVFAMSLSANQEMDVQKTTVQIYDRRGNWVADGILTIRNPRNGKIGISMSTYCHVSVDEIQMDISIEKANGNSWEQIDYLTYNFYPNGGTLLDAEVSTEKPCPELNKDYRLVGWHTVFVGSGSESLKSTTPGVTITNR